jgi:hypothetical protein
MREVRSQAQEVAEDIFFGQGVIIWARWFVILAGAILALWSASDVSELTGSIMLVVALMAINFFVHGRYLMERPVNRTLLSGLSLIDLVIITLIVLAWQGQVGLNSPFFIFYYPVLLGFSFVFPPGFTIAYTLIALGAYAGAVFLSDPDVLLSSPDMEVMATRLITLAATGGLGTYYWRIQRQRRRLAAGSEPAESAS